MSFSDWAEEKILQALFNNVSLAVTTPYISLHTADPGETGASECIGGSYARLSSDWDPASTPAGTILSNNVYDFTLMPACTVTHVGVWDALTVGNFIIGGAFNSSRVVNAGDTYRIPDAAITITLT